MVGRPPCEAACQAFCAFSDAHHALTKWGGPFLLRWQQTPLFSGAQPSSSVSAWRPVAVLAHARRGLVGALAGGRPAVSLDVRRTHDPPRTGNRGPGRRAHGVVGSLVSGPAGRAWLVAFLSRSTESTWPPREVLTYWWICTSC